MIYKCGKKVSPHKCLDCANIIKRGSRCYSCAAKKRWSIPSYIQKRKVGQDKRWEKNEEREKIGRAVKKWLSNKENHPFWGKRHPVASKRMRGTKNPGYVNGLSSLSSRIRALGLYSSWRNRVFQRDGFSCCLCGEGGHLNAHHIVSFVDLLGEFMKDGSCSDNEQILHSIQTFDPMWDIDNGITLCVHCHYQKKYKMFQ